LQIDIARWRSKNERFHRQRARCIRHEGRRQTKRGRWDCQVSHRDFQRARWNCQL